MMTTTPKFDRDLTEREIEDLADAMRLWGTTYTVWKENVIPKEESLGHLQQESRDFINEILNAYSPR